MNKYGRHPSIVAREKSSLFEEYANILDNSNVTKTSFDAIEQINRILGNKSKYSTVDEAVLDMQKRTGLYEHLRKVQAANEKEGNILQEVPIIQTYVDNYIEDHPDATVFSVIHDMVKNQQIRKKLPSTDDVPPEVYKYINDKLTEYDFRHSDKTHSTQIGKVDLSVDDQIFKDNNPFSGCEPNTDGK
jgi:hypothetical protein